MHGWMTVGWRIMENQLRNRIHHSDRHIHTEVFFVHNLWTLEYHNKHWCGYLHKQKTYLFYSFFCCCYLFGGCVHEFSIHCMHSLKVITILVMYTKFTYSYQKCLLSLLLHFWQWHWFPVLIYCFPVFMPTDQESLTFLNQLLNQQLATDSFCSRSWLIIHLT